MKVSSDFSALMKKSLAKNEPKGLLEQVLKDDGNRYHNQETFFPSPQSSHDSISGRGWTPSTGGGSLIPNTPDEAAGAAILCAAAGTIGLVVATQTTGLGLGLVAGALAGVGLFGVVLCATKAANSSYGSPDGY